jgi:hypothetical protein
VIEFEDEMEIESDDGKGATLDREMGGAVAVEEDEMEDWVASTAKGGGRIDWLSRDFFGFNVERGDGSGAKGEAIGAGRVAIFLRSSAAERV